MSKKTFTFEPSTYIKNEKGYIIIGNDNGEGNVTITEGTETKKYSFTIDTTGIISVIPPSSGGSKQNKTKFRKLKNNRKSRKNFH